MRNDPARQWSDPTFPLMTTSPSNHHSALKGTRLKNLCFRPELVYLVTLLNRGQIVTVEFLQAGFKVPPRSI
jgi:hypothetical protein